MTTRPFEWLATDRGHLRSNLRDLERWIREGRLDELPAEERATLELALSTIAEDTSLSVRARKRLASVLRAMGGLSQ